MERARRWDKHPRIVYGIGYTVEVIPLSEAARRLGIQADTLRRQIHRGKLKARKRQLAGYEVWMVSEAELERYERENKR